ncbi:hypothetical protein ACP70R_002765 [Stipagrostis hirtigluma subsp. patula]
MEIMVVKAMVVSASNGVIKPLLAKLTTLMGDEYKKFKGVRRQVSFLKDELATINAFLETLELIDELDPLVKNWRSHVREMAYDIEDCIDAFMHHLGDTDPKEGIMNKTVRCLKTIRQRHRIAHQIDELKTRVLEASKRRKRYNLDYRVSNSGLVVVDPQVTSLYAKAGNLVGIDGPRKELVNLLMDTQQKLKVVSIVGFGGLGKTTLAKEVYHNIGEKFRCKAFFSVSQRPDMTKILNGIQSKLGICGSSSICEVQDIIDSIKEYLENQRYFIVVDDLWDVQTWNTISGAFPENENGSRIIVTTRLEDVASWACLHHHERIYRMKPLDSQDSRTLFFNRIFGCEDSCPVQFEKVSAEILKKCGGLPLATITIASLLASQPATLKEWENTLHSLTMHFGTHPTLEGMRKILDLSYKNLPPHLRTCLLYLGIYPEDYEIKRDGLIRQWVAEGFVSNFHGQDFDDIAKSYFNELINRSLIQPESTDCGEVLSCKVHDMMLDLILHRCKEDNFITVLCNSKDIIRHHDNKARRLYLNCSNADVADGRVSGTILTSLSQVRSFAVYGESNCVPPLVLFKYLRVLILDIFSYEMECKVDLTSISQLFQLRYLKISGNYILDIVLPTKIQGLVHLETLDIYGVEIIPSDIIYLPRLSHLIVDADTRLPDGIGSIKSLRTLGRIDLLSATIKAIGELINLRELTLCYTDYDDIPGSVSAKINPLVSSLGKLSELRSLSLDIKAPFGSQWPKWEICDDDDQLGSLWEPPLRVERLQLSRWLFPRVPKWIGCHLSSLCSLRLYVREMSSDGVRALGELPSLLFLGLEIKFREGMSIVDFGSAGFPSLKHLDFSCGKDSGAYMRFQAGVMRKLRRLTLHFGFDRKKVEATPAGMKHLPSLRSIQALAWTCDESEIRDIEFQLRNATQAHPNRPSFTMDRYPVNPVNARYTMDEDVPEECLQPKKNKGYL